MNRYEKQKLAVEKAMGEKVKAYQEIYKKADDEDRDPTEEERLEVESHLKAIEVLKKERTEADENIKTLQGVEDIGRSLGPPVSSGLEFRDSVTVTNEPPRMKSLGEMFVESDGYNKIKEKGFSGQWTTGPMEFGTKAGTLLEGAGSPGTGTGGGLLTVPQVAPGVVDKLFQRLTIADLLASGQATGNTVRYVVEGTATSGAAGVAEGGAKPASDLGLSTVDEPIKKLATSLTASDEMLEDATQVQSYINNRLSLFVRIKEENSILRGAGTNDLIGFSTSGNTRGINILSGTATAGTAMANLLFNAINGTRGSSFLEPDAIVMNPTNWATLRLSTDTAGQYFGGGPFQGQYGNGNMTPLSGQVTGAIDTLWGKPVVVTSAIGAGTALLGAFGSGAQLWRRSGVTVEATNSHADYFLNNLVAIRAESRLGLAVYRPSAFTEVRFL